MNTNDQFEQRLRNQPLRDVPPEWRGELLDTALRAARAGRSFPAPSSASFAHWLSAILWPHPKAWAGLGAVWLLILGLNLFAREPARPAMARHTAPPSPQLRQLLKQQERMFVELLGPIAHPSAKREPGTPPPRSQRGQGLRNA